MNTIHIITNGDTNRIKQTIKALNTYNLSYKIHMIPKHKTNGKLGCFLSHIKLYRYAQKHNLDYICIAEDNICSSNRIKEYHHIQHDILVIQKQPWEVIYLGGWITNPFRLYHTTSLSTLYETHATHGTSFYMIHKQLYQKILSCYKNYIQSNDIQHIDDVINFLALKPYVSVPLLFYRDYQLKTTNLYYSNSLCNDLLSYFHYYYRQSTFINFLQKCAIYGKYIILVICILIGILVFVLIKNRYSTCS